MNNKINKAAALKYYKEQTSAPILSAKGKYETARKIIETAKENSIPIVENEMLIDLLLNVDIGDEIPVELYRAVAEIYSFIINLDKN